MTDRSGSLNLEGALTLAEVPQLDERLSGRFSSEAAPSTVSLAGVTAADSGALALLLEWQARAAVRGRRVRFESPPRSLRVVARLTGAADVLGWNDSGSTQCQKEKE